MSISKINFSIMCFWRSVWIPLKGAAVKLPLHVFFDTL